MVEPWVSIYAEFGLGAATRTPMSPVVLKGRLGFHRRHGHGCTASPALDAGSFAALESRTEVHGAQRANTRRSSGAHEQRVMDDVARSSQARDVFGPARPGTEPQRLFPICGARSTSSGEAEAPTPHHHLRASSALSRWPFCGPANLPSLSSLHLNRPPSFE